MGSLEAAVRGGRAPAPRSAGSVTRARAGDHSATLRLLAPCGLVVGYRPRVVAAAVRARRGGPRAYTLWPDARRPMLAADAGYPPAAEWLRGTMVPTLRRLPDAATWMSLRAGAALVGDGAGLAERVGTGLMDTGTRPRLALYSPSGQAVSKAVCFLFREGEPAPHIVVKAMAEPRFAWRLRRESELLECVRRNVPDGGHQFLTWGKNVPSRERRTHPDSSVSR